MAAAFARFHSLPTGNGSFPFLRKLNLKTPFKILGLAIPGYIIYNNCHPFSAQKDTPLQEEPIAAISPQSTLIERPCTFWEKLRWWVAHILRFLHLLAIFTPSLLALPLRLFKQTEKVWLGLFVKGVERAGVVWIKAFQYLSHRRDVIGP